MLLEYQNSRRTEDGLELVLPELVLPVLSFRAWDEGGRCKTGGL